ncbi:MAG: hypothetical protein ACYCZ2_01505 [Lutibacter sp.]
MVFKNEIVSALKVHNGLKFNSDKNELNGKINLPSGDNYNIKIDLSPYPRFFPKVYEMDGRIPKKVDRHIYTDSGACCFTTGAKSQILLKTKVESLLIFLNEIVVKYFENDSFYEINGHYFTEEYAHGSLGVVEAYMEILEVKSVDIIGYLIVERLNDKIISDKDLCYCNSRVQLSKCNKGKHSKNYKNFLLIEKDVLKNDLAHFKNVINKHTILKSV